MLFTASYVIYYLLCVASYFVVLLFVVSYFVLLLIRYC